MNNRLILAQRLDLAHGYVEAHKLDGGLGEQYRWDPPPWPHGFFRVYVHGHLAAVTQETWYNHFTKACRVEVFAEVQDNPN